LAAEGGFDFACVDSDTADLHLLVNAAEEFKSSLGEPSCAVTGSEQTRTTLRRIRIRNEPLGGERGPIEVSASQSGTAQVDLTWFTDGHRKQPIVQHMQFHVRGTPDRDPSIGFLFLAVPVRGDRRFGKTVELVDARA
jgi:hypothetical protein